MNEWLNLVDRGWIWIQGRKNSKCGRIAAGQGTSWRSSGLFGWVDRGGEEAAGELWDWGRRDLHEGAGMIGGRQLQRPPSFWPAMPRDGELSGSPSHPNQILEGPFSAPVLGSLSGMLGLRVG